MNRDAFLTAERARELLAYDPNSGTLTWRARGRGRPRAPIGSRRKSTVYLEVRVDGHRHLVHRVIWLIVHGHWPASEIDHRSGLATDNRLSELREATPAQNKANRRTPRNNTSGYKGVKWDKGKGKWAAVIMANKKLHFLGLFEEPEQANLAYVAASTRLHGEFRRA